VRRLPPSSPRQTVWVGLERRCAPWLDGVPGFRHLESTKQTRYSW